ncbi:flagellar basal body L-ring protein FlgH [Sediminicoccus rosea]|jgi:flagellar L-ring protein precursor FlgH|uniref:Flagellar L-ring protein n=1 Tax=Sediminicoccus rosea TaxID=1225128 RepID=A0ABZ0PB58_9PROT|nr:flagellar basal body L-ring protein FlgH [Sediminicoccus rosea]WPB82924.1 flagellar basal body L-ring protein FlgH [Sediminicoccus rosea]
MKAALILLPLALAACGQAERLSRIGRAPDFTPVTDPTQDPRWRPVSMPMPAPQEAPPLANSLWRPGSRTFLRDQRAAQVGDLITILVTIDDDAQLANRTQRSRTGSETAAAVNLYGQERVPRRLYPPGADPAALLNTDSAGNSDGNGNVRRNETVNLRLAGTVTQTLPNGNMVVMARQEVRVNNEMRELSLQGILRPQDIASDNTVRHDRLAEARISYGGRGSLSDIQQPRLGQQLLDIISPF